jgi:hypothetical protein
MCNFPYHHRHYHKMKFISSKEGTSSKPWSHKKKAKQRTSSHKINESSPTQKERKPSNASIYLSLNAMQRPAKAQPSKAQNHFKARSLNVKKQSRKKIKATCEILCTR